MTNIRNQEIAVMAAAISVVIGILVGSVWLIRQLPAGKQSDAVESFAVGVMYGTIVGRGK